MLTQKKIKKETNKKKVRDASGKDGSKRKELGECNAPKWREAEGTEGTIAGTYLLPRSTLHVGGGSRNSHMQTHPICAHLGLTC